LTYLGWFILFGYRQKLDDVVLLVGGAGRDLHLGGALAVGRDHWDVLGLRHGLDDSSRLLAKVAKDANIESFTSAYLARGSMMEKHFQSTVLDASVKVRAATNKKVFISAS
jgi:hypothetical protein